MKSVFPAILAAALLPTAALALATEQHGNAPVGKQPEWADGVLDVVNLRSRVYSRWVNGNEDFYFQGDAAALNEALKKYAAVKADERVLVLLPGKGNTKSFDGKSIDFGWRFDVPSGIYRAMTGNKHAALTVYIDAKKPRGKIDRDRAGKWLEQLDDEAFATRQAAAEALAKLGADAKPVLKEALKAGPPLEARRRIEALLAKLGGPDASDLEVPAGLTVVTAEDLLAKHLKAVADTDARRSALAIHALGELAAYSDKVVPALAGKLGKDTNEYPRRMAALTLGSLGAAAKDALPKLKEGMTDPDKGLREVFQKAVEQIEKAKPEPGRDAEVKRRLAILADLSELKKPARK